MNNKKLIVAIMLVLLASNITMFILLMKGHDRGHGPKTIIVEKLHFDDEQIIRYDSLIQLHRKAVNKNEAIMCNLRCRLFEQLKYQQDSAKIDSIITIIAQQQAKAEHINYAHFLEIKALCKPGQQKEFDELTLILARIENNAPFIYICVNLLN